MQTKFIKFPGARTQVCLRGLCELYRVGGIANIQKMWLPFSIASKLSHAGIIVTQRGRTGGSMLPPDFPEKTLQDLIDAVEPESSAKSASTCLFEMALRRTFSKIKIIDCFPEKVMAESPLGETWR